MQVWENVCQRNSASGQRFIVCLIFSFSFHCFVSSVGAIKRPAGRKCSEKKERLTETGCEGWVGVGHVDAVVQDVGGGGGRGVAEHDALGERRVGGGKGGWRGGLVWGRLGEGGGDGGGHHV